MSWSTLEQDLDSAYWRAFESQLEEFLERDEREYYANLFSFI